MTNPVAAFFSQHPSGPSGDIADGWRIHRAMLRCKLLEQRLYHVLLPIVRPSHRLIDLMGRSVGPGASVTTET